MKTYAILVTLCFGFFFYTNGAEAQIGGGSHPHGPVNELKKVKIIPDDNPPKAVVDAVEEDFGSLIPWYFHVGYSWVLEAPFSKPYYLVSFVDLSNTLYLLSYSMQGELENVFTAPVQF